MNDPAGSRATALLYWIVLGAATVVPLALAVASPLQKSREALWIFGGMAGIVALVLLLVQPLLASALMPGPTVLSSRRGHRWLGAAVVVAVVFHVSGLYLYSPDDITDALLLVAPTPFAVYGVIGLVSVVLTGLLVAIRTRSGLRYATWRIVHNSLSVVVIVASIVHAVLIEGTMEFVSKITLCAAIVIVTVVALVRTYWR